MSKDSSSSAAFAILLYVVTFWLLLSFDGRLAFAWFLWRLAHCIMENETQKP